MRTDQATSPFADEDPKAIEDFGDFMGSFAGHAKELVRSEREYLMLLGAKRAADLSRRLIGAVLLLILCGITLAIGSIAAAQAIGRALGDSVSGYLVVAGCYVVITIAMAALWKGALGKRFMLGLINGFHGN